MNILAEISKLEVSDIPPELFETIQKEINQYISGSTGSENWLKALPGKIARYNWARDFLVPALKEFQPTAQPEIPPMPEDKPEEIRVFFVTNISYFSIT